jgi:hypothetical protein
VLYSNCLSPSLFPHIDMPDVALSYDLICVDLISMYQDVSCCSKVMITQNFSKCFC